MRCARMRWDFCGNYEKIYRRDRRDRRDYCELQELQNYRTTELQNFRTSELRNFRTSETDCAFLLVSAQERCQQGVAD